MKPNFLKAWDMVLEDAGLEDVLEKISKTDLRRLFDVAVEGLCYPPEPAAATHKNKTTTDAQPGVSEREQFEAWATNGRRLGGIEKMFAWEAWKAATKLEREACAKVCNEADKSTHPADLADLIRLRSKTEDMKP